MWEEVGADSEAGGSPAGIEGTGEEPFDKQAGEQEGKLNHCLRLCHHSGVRQ